MWPGVEQRVQMIIWWQGDKLTLSSWPLSYGATFISTAAIVGFGGVAANYGMGILWLVFLNILIGIFIAFVFFGKRTRKMGHNMGALTFPEFLSKRFDSKFIQYFSGAVIFIGMPLYASVVLVGMVQVCGNNTPNRL